MIAVVDYCKGNLRSVERGLINAGGDACITDNPEVIGGADAIVLPGVGAFADASATMLQTGQMQAIRAALAQGKFFLGICLGEHLLFEAGTEGADCAEGANHGQEADHAEKSSTSQKAVFVEGLGILPGVVDRIPEFDSTGKRYKIPHVGWNSIDFDPTCDCPLLEGIKPGEYFYFTHSYIAPDSKATVATTTHSVTFPCVVQKGERIFGVQFHPEKSSDAGAHVLGNFVRMVQENKHV